MQSLSFAFIPVEGKSALRHFNIVSVALLFLISQHLLSAANPLSKFMSGRLPRTDSCYTVLMDANTGKVLYAENDLAHRSPASLTKMAAAIVLIENGKLTDTVTAPNAMQGIPESSLHLSPGETISLHDLLYAMLLRSANDTPVAGAYYLSGSIPKFVELMNQKVRAIGCANTNFVTPNGLYAPGHYSCPYDLALIARYALNNLPFFDQVVRTRRYRVTRSVHKSDSIVVNTASTFLSDFPGADGVKTGYISQAGHCFVGGAKRNGWQLIAVAMNSPRCRSDVVQLLSYGFANFEPHLIYRSGYDAGYLSLPGRTVPVVTAGDLWDATPRGAGIPSLSDYLIRTVSLEIPDTANIHVGEAIGSVTLYHGSQSVMTVDAIATRASAGEQAPFGTSSSGNRRLIKIIITAVALIAAAPIVYVSARILDFILHARKITKNSRRRRTHIA